MKLLLVSLYFYPDKTGVPKYSGEMAQWLAAQGHEVHVIAGVPHYPGWRREPGYPGWRFSEEHWEGVKIHRVPHYLPGGGHSNAVRRLLIEGSFLLTGLLRLLGLMIQRRRFDATIAVCPSLLAGFIAYFHRLVTGTPWVFHVQDFQVDAAMQLKLVKAKSAGALLLRLESHLLRAAQKVTSITPAMCGRAIEKGVRPENLGLLPNWGDLRSISPSPHDNAFRRALGVAPDQTLVMYAGAMGAKQGLDIVLDAAERLLQRPSVRFVMIGGGAEWERLRQAAGDRALSNMQFLPLQPIERLNDMLAAADIHLVVQKREAADIVMPSKLTNIFAAGRPAIGTADPGTALYDAIVQSDGGLAIQPENSDLLFSAIDTLASDVPRRAAMGSGARAYADQYLDQDQIMARFQTELLQLVSGRVEAADLMPAGSNRPSATAAPRPGQPPRSRITDRKPTAETTDAGS